MKRKLIKIVENLTVRSLCILLIFMMSFIFSGPVRYHSDYDIGVRIIYLDNGNLIECRKTWIDNEQIFCQKYNGTLGFPLSQIDMEKTFQDILLESGEEKKRVLKQIRKYRKME